MGLLKTCVQRVWLLVWYVFMQSKTLCKDKHGIIHIHTRRKAYRYLVCERIPFGRVVELYNLMYIELVYSAVIITCTACLGAERFIND